MLGLTAIIYVFLGATLAGILIAVALTMGLETGKPILYSAIAGFFVGLPLFLGWGQAD